MKSCSDHMRILSSNSDVISIIFLEVIVSEMSASREIVLSNIYVLFIRP